MATAFTGPPIVAHAFGTRYDLPVPLWLFVVGGAAVVFVSFLVVLPTAVAAPYEGATLRDRVSLRRSAVVRASISCAVIVALAVIGWSGSQKVSENILPTAFWLLAWIAVPLSCGVIGDWTRSVNPFAAIARAADRPGLRRAVLGGTERVRWPSWLGFWPAAVLFFVIAAGELIYNATATLPSVTATAIVSYLLISGLAGLVFGADEWSAHGEVFSVLWSTWGRLGWFRFGSPGRSGLGGGLEVPFEARVSRLTFILLLLVSVSFDGLLATPAVKAFELTLPPVIGPRTTGFALLETAVFLALVGLAWGLFGAFAFAVRVAGGLQMSVIATLSGLMRSLMPISFGYLLAHNASYLAINGQLLIPLLGNPGGWDGVHLLPAPFNDSYEVNTNLLPSSVLWYGEVAVIIAVHIAAVVLAHRYLARSARAPREARRAEWPWIAAMVGYTMTSLWLLAQPVVQESPAASSAARVQPTRAADATNQAAGVSPRSDASSSAIRPATRRTMSSRIARTSSIGSPAGSGRSQSM